MPRAARVDVVHVPGEANEAAGEQPADELPTEAPAAEPEQPVVALATGELPTEEQALAIVRADPVRRSVLSKSGYVTLPKIVRERDESGFAKA